MSYHPAELVRPDNIMRSGIIQPFNVVSQSPVRFARQEINPFVQAIRPEGSQLVTMDGALGGPAGLGIISPEVLRTISGGTMGAAPITFQGGLGADVTDAANAAEKYKSQRLWYLLGGLALGAIGGWAMTKLL